MRYLINQRGVTLCLYFWPASTPHARGIIQVLHGHGSYIPYEFLKCEAPGQPPVYKGSWVQTMNDAGYSVCGVDNQGTGRSSGLRGFCNSFDEYVDDGLLLTKTCTEMQLAGFDKSLPKFLVGGSMGGCLAVMMALRERSLFSGVALLAPMLSLEKAAKRGINRLLRPLGLLLNAIVPAAAIVATAKNEMYPDLQLQYDCDPACYHGMTRARNAHEYLRVTAWLMRNLHKVDFPFIVFHSEHDTMCDCNGSKALYAQATSSDKTLRLVNHMWHVITKEKDHEKILADVLQWFDVRGN